MSAWHPISTWNHWHHHTEYAFFWVVPKTADEAYVDSSGTPIVSTRAPHWLYGRYETWSSLEKATHWREPLEPPDAGE